VAVIDYLDRGYQISPQALYLVSGERGVTYADARIFTNRLANALLRSGLRAPATGAVLSANDPLAWQCTLALWRAGLIWSPVNPRSTAQQIVAQLDAFDCEILFFQSAFAPLVAAHHSSLPKIKYFICIDGPAPEGLTRSHSLHEWIEGCDDATPAIAPGMDDVCAITPTGGTTGQPKGVMNTHRSFQTMVANWLSVLSYGANEPIVNLAAAPLTHTAGVFSFMATLRGGRVVILPRPDPQLLVETIERERVTELFLPPTVIYALLDLPGIEQRDFSSLRYFLYGAAPMAPDKLRRALAIFGPVMIQGYGQSEAPAAISCLRPEEHFDGDAIASNARLSSCGRAFPFTTVSIRDDGDRPVGAGEVGEICVRGDVVMKGYYKDPQRTTQTIVAGWLRTGDVGFLDAHNFLHITDRKKDIIITGGFNVFSVEVEAMINAHPAVRDCAVIGVPDDKWGEAVKAIVELKPGCALSADELLALCKERLGGVKAPKSIDFTQQLPRSPAGKILKRELREPFWAAHSRRI
jgi:acyl-CoA synthetase (AMP-forming)/AMP-acid ligase II